LGTLSKRMNGSASGSAQAAKILPHLRGLPEPHHASSDRPGED